MPRCLLAFSVMATIAASAPCIANGNQLEAAFDQLVQQQFAHLGTRVQARLSSDLPQGVNCPSPRLSLPRSYDQRSPRLHVAVSCEGRQYFLQAELTVSGYFLRATRDIDAGSTLSADMIEVAEGDITGLLGSKASDPGAVVGSVTRRPLKQGQVLFARNLEKPKLVERGDRINVETRGRGFRIARKGEALQAGGVGDRISIRISRKKILNAVIAGPGTAIVQL